MGGNKEKELEALQGKEGSHNIMSQYHALLTMIAKETRTLAVKHECCAVEETQTYMWNVE